MRNLLRISIIPSLLLGLFFVLTNSCNKSDTTTIVAIPATVTDIDGNIYHTVTIGSQVWMLENLKTTKYNNGDPIANITVDSLWRESSSGAYCNFNNEISNVDTYGRLYNFYAVNDSRLITPVGWRVPTDADWSLLTYYLGGDTIAGNKMKEVGTTHWLSPNTKATNLSGFTALPGYFRDGLSGSFPLPDSSTNYQGVWWSSSSFYNGNYGAWMRSLSYANGKVSRAWCSYTQGCSIRCVMVR